MRVFVLHMTRPDKEFPLIEAFSRLADARRTALAFIYRTRRDYGHTDPVMPTISYHKALATLHRVTGEDRVKVQIKPCDLGPGANIEVHPRPIKASRWRRATKEARDMWRFIKS